MSPTVLVLVVGVLAAPSTPASTDPQLVICSRVDAQWRPVGAATHFKAGEGFNALLIEGRPFGTDYIGFVIHRQGEDGQDEDFVMEWQVAIQDPTRSRAYATRGALAWLAPGSYSIYAVDWATYATPEVFGNLETYLAKVTITVDH